MKKVTLQIDSGYESERFSLEEELSIGRTGLSDVVLEDQGLSRVNTTIFRDDEDVLVVDENSSNGTFLNGERLRRDPRILYDGDRLKLGSETEVKIVFGESGVEASEAKSETKRPRPKESAHKANDSATVQNYLPDIATAGKKNKKKETPMVLIVAALSTFGIIFLALIGILVANYFDSGVKQVGRKPTPKSNPNATIPIRVIDPLPGKDKENLDELVQYWEVQEAEIKVEDMREIASSTTTTTAKTGYNLKVPLAFWKQQYAISRAKHYGNNPKGLKNFKELCCGVPKQTRKIGEMQRRNPPYKIPMDFADLARKRMAGELIELPMATNYWVLDVGGSSNTKDFTNFDWKGATVALPNSQDYQDLAKLAANFDGEKYDMNNPTHRRQMKIRLLRMFHPNAKPVLEKLAKSYHAKFNRPLRITSLSRSMEYQIGLNKFNPNSFRVRGPGSLPPHTSGCAFDLSRKFMSAEEQNFVQEMLVQMENARQLDGLREGNVNACFHVFIYDDGAPPKGF